MYFGQVNVEEMHCCSVYGIMEKASVTCFDDPVVLCFMVDIRLWLRGFSEGYNNVSPLADFLLPAPLSHGIRLLVSSSTQNIYLTHCLPCVTQMCSRIFWQPTAWTDMYCWRE